MEKKLYDLMDWGKIEGITFSDEDNPTSVLGPHVTKDGILIQAFFPEALSVKLIPEKGKKSYDMELADEEGFFAVLIPGKKLFSYVYRIEYPNNVIVTRHDPYAFEPFIDAVDQKRFNSGIHYNIYEKLGAHIREIDGVKGVDFAVWAPAAVRVSVVGDFNQWDGRRNPMERLGDSGIFELFIPELGEGEIYKYEIRMKDKNVKLKSDPYGNRMEYRPNNASIVADLSFEWEDSAWLEKRKTENTKVLPMSVLEIHLGSFKKPDMMDEADFYNYRELAPVVADYAKKMNYTHVELMPIMEHPLDASWGYQVTGYYAATARYGTPTDFMYFMNYLHKENIGVILDWVPAHFPKDACGLAEFDGTCLYEHRDPRQGCHPHWGTLIYNYGRPEVRNFLIANVLFWIEKFHADGIRMDAVASMLYLDYGKQDGEWVANMYGGHENLEAVDFLRQLNKIVHKRKDGSILIAEESTAWPKITEPVEKDGLGFDYKWNMGWMNDYLDYIRCDPLFRKGKHGELTFSMIYNYSEDFILPLSHDEVVHGKGSMIAKMPGGLDDKFSNLRLTYGYMMCHPGKKHLFMGQDFGQFTEWNENVSLEWELTTDYKKNRQLNQYVSELNKFYRKHPALYEMDYDPKGFEWISCLDADHSILVFVRRAKKAGETLFIVCNFTPVVYNKLQIGVPFAGKYKEIFNSDAVEFGGSGNVNPRMKQSQKQKWEDRKDSVSITVPPLGIAVFLATPLEKQGKTAKGKA